MKKQTLLQKSILVIEEAAAYLDISTSHLYKLTATRSIEHFRNGKKIYFRKEGLDKWMLNNYVKMFEEMKSTLKPDLYLGQKLYLPARIYGKPGSAF